MGGIPGPNNQIVNKYILQFRHANVSQMITRSLIGMIKGCRMNIWIASFVVLPCYLLFTQF